MVVRAEGMYYWNDRGDKIIDGASGLFCVRGRPWRAVKSPTRSARSCGELDFVAPFTRGHPKQFELATRVAELTPGDLEPHLLHQLGVRSRRYRDEGRARLSPGARPGRPHDVRLARARLPRRQFRRRVAGRHGQQPPQVRSDAAGHRAHAPHASAGTTGSRPAKARTAWSSPKTCMRFVNLYGAENIAACFVEPIAGSTGCLVPPKGYLQRLRDICDQHGILLVFDEVITGLGRTGAEFRRAELRRDARPHHDGQGAHQRRAADGRRRRFPSASTTRSWARRRKARSSSSTATRTPAIRPRARRASPRSTSTRTRACSRRAARCRRISSTRSFRCRTFRRSPTCAATACSPAIDVASRTAPPGARGHALQKKLFDSGMHLKATGDCVIVAPPLIAEKTHVDTIVDILRKTLQAL